MNFAITHHARDQLAAKGAGEGIDQIPDLEQELASARPTGAAYKGTEHYMLPCGLIAVVAVDLGRRVVVTVITQAQAVANLQDTCLLNPTRKMRLLAKRLPSGLSRRNRDTWRRVDKSEVSHKKQRRRPREKRIDFEPES